MREPTGRLGRLRSLVNYCAGCRYDPKRRTGPDACPFNYLYWTFLDQVKQEKFDVGQRMALVLKQLEKIPAAELGLMREARDFFLATMTPDKNGWAFHSDRG